MSRQLNAAQRLAKTESEKARRDRTSYAPRHGELWEDHEIRWLWDRTLTDHEIAKVIGRSAHAIDVKRGTMVAAGDCPIGWTGKTDVLLERVSPGTDADETCNVDGCKGIIETYNEPCYCNATSMPPCSACENSKYRCDTCDRDVEL